MTLSDRCCSTAFGIILTKILLILWTAAAPATEAVSPGPILILRASFFHQFAVEAPTTQTTTMTRLVGVAAFE